MFGYQIYSAVQVISFFKNVNGLQFEIVKAIFLTIPSWFCDELKKMVEEYGQYRGYTLAKFFSLFLRNTISLLRLLM